MRKARNSSLIPRKQDEAAERRQFDNADHNQDGYKKQTHGVSSALRIVLES
jgi:hypothetical protein